MMKIVLYDTTVKYKTEEAYWLMISYVSLREDFKSQYTPAVLAHNDVIVYHIYTTLSLYPTLLNLLGMPNKIADWRRSQLLKNAWILTTSFQNWQKFAKSL